MCSPGMLHAAAISLSQGIVTRGFKGFTPRPDPFAGMLKMGADKELMASVTETPENALSRRLTRLAFGRLGREVSVPAKWDGGCTGSLLTESHHGDERGGSEGVQSRRDCGEDCPAHLPACGRLQGRAGSLLLTLPTEKVLEDTSRVLAASLRRPKPYQLPESEVLSKDAQAGNKRFSFVFVDTSKSEYAVTSFIKSNSHDRHGPF